MPGSQAAAEALRTTDSVTKVATTTVELPDADGGPVRVTVSGIAKGVGMIHPNMATMLSVILTDAAVEPETLWGLLRPRRGPDLGPALGRRRHQHERHGLRPRLRASAGARRSRPARRGGGARRAPSRPSPATSRASRPPTARAPPRSSPPRSTGAADDAEARAVARAVVSSSLVKAAAHGTRPELGPHRRRGRERPPRRCRGPRGRRAGAGGGGAAPARPAASTRRGCASRSPGYRVFDGAAGGPVAFDRAAARAAMDGPELVIALDLGLGDGTGEAFGCDLTEAYVIENSEYTT